MERVILHCDLNSFYAAVECLYHPEIRDKPVIVGGDVDKRHGIVLTKNQIAKRYDIKTGEAIWQARLKCPDLIVIKPRFSVYLRFSAMVRAILSDYSDLIEPFGIDESWLDVTESVSLYGSGKEIADQIRERIKREVGITASVGVSFNKVFSKLGSDYKKPDATTVITRENMNDIVFPLPSSELLYVGPATARKLATLGIHTIGDIAHSDIRHLKRHLGKHGEYLWVFANGLENSPVKAQGMSDIVKSIGNSTTTPKDIKNMNDLKIVAYVLAESVGARLREQQLSAQTICVSIRDTQLKSISRQIKLPFRTDMDKDIAEAALALFEAHTKEMFPLRSIGINATDLAHSGHDIQLSLFVDHTAMEKERKLNQAVDAVRQRYGFDKLQRGIMLTDRALSGFNPKDDHVIFPIGHY